MTTAEIVTEQALALARSGQWGDEPVRRPSEVAENRRVAVVRAAEHQGGP